jgi:hypothetical protein
VGGVASYTGRAVILVDPTSSILLGAFLIALNKLSVLKPFSVAQFFIGLS